MIMPGFCEVNGATPRRLGISALGHRSSKTPNDFRSPLELVIIAAMIQKIGSALRAARGALMRALGFAVIVIKIL